MKKLMMWVAMLGVAALAGEVFAGGGCCPASKAKKSGYDSACSSALSGIELTAEQKAEIAKIEDECKAKGSTVDACSDSMAKIRNVLTDDQRASFDAATAKSSKKAGCGS